MSQHYMDEERISVFWDARVLEHDTGHGMWETVASDLLDEQERHPENAVRMRNMRSVLERGPVADRLDWRPGRLATVAELETVHTPEYVASIRDQTRTGSWLTSTTKVAEGSWEPLLAAAGTCLAAADAVLDGEARMAYALVRPPGHHAQPDRADGYCAFSHASLVAQRARDRGVERVATVDWDVHHGNGTQECFYGRDDVLTVSLHMVHGPWGPSHTQTGEAAEVGTGRGAGHNVNVALPLGSGDSGYLRALREVVAPILRQFQPDLIVAASGQDASTFDPNGRHNLTMSGFHGIGRTLREFADELTDTRMVLTQEGGYARSYAAYCLHATVDGLLAREPSLTDPLAYIPDSTSVSDALSDTSKTLRSHWNL